jgi:hypothetical protein
MNARTLGLLGSLAVLSHGAFLQVSCTSENLDRAATGGIDGSGVGGRRGLGGQAGTAGCFDGPTGQGGTECGAPRFVVVDANTGAVICDPTFTVVGGDAAVICDPSGNPTPLLAVDGAVTCAMALDSLTNVTVPVDLQVVAPGYQPTLVSQVRGCVVGVPRSTTVVLTPTAEGGVVVREAGGALATSCAIDDSVDDCAVRGLHRYVCPASEAIAPAGCSTTGELNYDGIFTRCCP